MPETPDYYELLGINPDASNADINAGFKRAAQYWHPDRNKSPNALSMMQHVTSARTTLLNAKSKRIYNGSSRVYQEWIRRSSAGKSAETNFKKPSAEQSSSPKAPDPSPPPSSSTYIWGAPARIVFGIFSVIVIFIAAFVYGFSGNNDSNEQLGIVTGIDTSQTPEQQNGDTSSTAITASNSNPANTSVPTVGPTPAPTPTPTSSSNPTVIPTPAPTSNQAISTATAPVLTQTPTPNPVSSPTATPAPTPAVEVPHTFSGVGVSNTATFLITESPFELRLGNKNAGSDGFNITVMDPETGVGIDGIFSDSIQGTNHSTLIYGHTGLMFLNIRGPIGEGWEVTIDPAPTPAVEVPHTFSGVGVSNTATFLITESPFELRLGNKNAGSDGFNITVMDPETGVGIDGIFSDSIQGTNHSTLIYGHTGLMFLNIRGPIGEGWEVTIDPAPG